MAQKKHLAPPTNFLVGLGATRKVSIQNPTSASSPPVLKANPSTSADIHIRPNAYVKVVLSGNLREPVILVGAAPNGLFYQQTVTLKPGQTIVLQAGSYAKTFRS